jgi:hypothetical protein
MLFGGRSPSYLRDTWEWDGMTWVERQVSTQPPAHIEHVMTYDASRRQIVMFGGAGVAGLFGDTWEWDGINWREQPPGPSPRNLSALAHDVVSHKTVLFGGYPPILGDLWERDGTTWILRAPSTGPSPRAGHALAFDPLRRRTVMFGGATDAGYTSDTWEWDGIVWEPVNTPQEPPPRQIHGMAYDVSRSVMVVFGGKGTGALLSDTWLLSSDAADCVRESCATGFDADRDGLIGCDDPDCAGRCDPLCATVGECAGDRPHCGDGTCSALEGCRLCPDDCGECPAVCGDFLCDPGESCTTCASDCPCP